jgi:hypothetical protein
MGFSEGFSLKVSFTHDTKALAFTTGFQPFEQSTGFSR